MPRITVTADTSAGHSEPAVLLDEHVQSVHLASGHAAAQLVERLAWAILDAEQQDKRTSKPVPAYEQIPVLNAKKTARGRESGHSLRRAVFVPSSVR